MLSSSNSWDAYAASAFGTRVVWCNRYGQRPGRLPGRPDRKIQTLADLPKLVGPPQVAEGRPFPRFFAVGDITSMGVATNWRSGPRVCPVPSIAPGERGVLIRSSQKATIRHDLRSVVHDSLSRDPGGPRGCPRSPAGRAMAGTYPPHQLPPARTPLDIHKERFARGEIGKAEFEDRRRVLGD